MTKRTACEFSQQVSLLVDGELQEMDRECVVEAMKRDVTLQHRWQNYHLIGDALRKDLPPFHFPQLSDRISAALQNEPTYFLPQTPSVPASNDSRRKILARRWQGWALAASLTAVAVVGILQVAPPTGSSADSPVVSQGPALSIALQEKIDLDGGGGSKGTVAHAGSDLKQVVVAQQAPRDPAADPQEAAAEPVVYAAVAVAEETEGLVTAARDVAASDLYDYLLNYQRYARTVSLENGFDPTIQLVGYTPQ